MNNEAPPPNIELYTRNGFAGPVTTVVTPVYAPAFKRSEGNYLPRTLNVLDVDTDPNPRALPTEILQGTGVSVEVARRTSNMDYALRNVYADEMHIILEGQALLESDFGELAVETGDLVVIPRSTSIRYRNIDGPLVSFNVVTESEMRIDPDHAPGVLNPVLDVHAPSPYVNPMGEPGEYEIVLRHRDGLTSYFYDGDPLRCLAVMGAPQVQKFNIDNVHGLGCRQGLVIPPRLVNDASTRTMVYHLGDRQVERPPIHHNADYDEFIIYLQGPGKWGNVERPGTLGWTPKGVVHQGPDENVPEGYQALLFETRANLTMTEAAKQQAQLMDTALYGPR